MFENIKNFILTRFRTIYIFEAKRNNKKIKYKNLKLIKYDSFNLVKNVELKNYLIKEKKLGRFKLKQILLVLYYKKVFVCVGWMYEGSNWHISEINKKINIKNKLLLFDFFTKKKFRNKGYYQKILTLIKNFKTKKIFLIYCLKNNFASRAGILNSKFKLKGELSFYV